MDQRPAARVVAFANQKGGVAKTTTVHCLGVAMARRGRQVLVVDLDPQACLTYSLGLDPDGLDSSLHDVLLGRADVADVRRQAPSVEGLAVVPSTIDLAGAEVHLLSRDDREHVLAQALESVLDDHDLVLVDCPPSLGVLTINGLAAARWLVVPMQCEMLSQRGVGQLLETVHDVRTVANADLEVLGVVATMYDRRTRHARHVLADIEDRYGLYVLEPPVPKSVRFAEGPELGRSILQHAPDAAGARAYLQLAEQIELLTLPPRG